MKATLLDITLIALGLALLTITNNAIYHAIGYFWIVAPIGYKLLFTKPEKQ